MNKDYLITEYYKRSTSSQMASSDEYMSLAGKYTWRFYNDKPYISTVCPSIIAYASGQNNFINQIRREYESISGN